MLYLRILCFILWGHCLYAQSVKDSLVRFSDLNFGSFEERDIFEKFLLKKDTSVLIDLFLVPVDPSKSISSKLVKEKINNCVTSLHQNVSSQKTNPKKIKLVYDQVHKTFLKVYKLENSFSEIFIQGEYNCVSASSLYAFVFSKMGIPFSIKEKPTHVYLYAYPEADRVLIETTSPNFGYYQFNNQFVDKYVKSLYESKQISKQVYDTESVNDLFNKYFFSDKDISFQQLLGLQFFNYGIFCADKNEHLNSLNWLKKAYIIYPSKSISFVLKNALYEELGNSKYEDSMDVKNYLLLMRYAEEESEESFRKVVVDEFIRIKNEQLINSNNIDLFRRSYQLIASSSKDSLFKKEIDFIYWYEMSRVSILSGKTDSLDFYLYNAYLIKPNNVDLRSLITHRSLNRISNYSDSKKILDDLKECFKKYPYLEDHENVRFVMSNCYLNLAFQAFAQGKALKGEELVKSFENNVKGKLGKSIDQRYVERTYTEACAYYYRIGNRAKAKSFLLKGLEYAPDNFGMKARLKQLN